MAVISVSIMSLTPGISSIGSSSVISSQIEMIERKIEHVKAELSELPTYLPEEAAGKESDAIDILSHYHYVLRQLMMPAAERDPRISYFGHDHALIEVNQNPSLDEINACQSLISEIEALGLDLSRARDLISYRAAALDMEEAAHVIEGFIAENRSLLASLPTMGTSPDLLPQDQYLNWNQKLLGLHKLREVVSGVVNDYQLGFMNSFTLEGKVRFLNSARHANELGLDIVRSIANIANREFSKLHQAGLAERCSRRNDLREISNNIEIIKSRYRVNKGILYDSLSMPSSESDSDYDLLAAGGAASTDSNPRTSNPFDFGYPPSRYTPDAYPFMLGGPSHGVRALEYDAAHSIARSSLCRISVHTLNTLGVCLVSPSKITPGLLGPRDKGSLDQPRIWQIGASGGDEEYRAFFKVCGGNCRYNDRALRRAADNLKGKLALLSTPFAALLSTHPLDGSYPRLVLSEPMRALAPSGMNPSLVDTFAEVGIHLVAPSKLAEATPDPEIDTQLSASKDADHITIAGAFSERSHYEIRCKTKSPSPEVLAEILQSVEQMMIALASFGVPAAMILTEGQEDKWISDWLEFERKQRNPPRT